jgi:hypothetical protein
MKYLFNIISIIFLSLFTALAQLDFSAPAMGTAGIHTTSSGGRVTPNVSWWKMQEGTGTTANDTVGSNNGTLVNYAEWQTKSPTGGTYSILMQYGGDEISVGSSSTIQPTGSFTFRFWLYPTSFAGTIDAWTTGVSGTMQIVVTTGGDISIGTWGTGALATSSTALTLNTWNYCALVYNGSTVTFYVNGSNAGGPTSISPSWSTASTYLIDANATTAYITDVGYWNETLTSSQITSDYDIFP